MAAESGARVHTGGRAARHETHGRETPAYLERYAATRFGWRRTHEAEEVYGPTLEDALEHRREQGLKNLRSTVARCRYSGATLAELVDNLRKLDQVQYPSVLVGEAIDRLDAMTTREMDELTGAVREAHDRRTGGVTVDRALQRLLFRLTSHDAFALALGCLRSTRTLRRQAARKFYQHRGLDDEARQIFAQEFENGSLEVLDVVVQDDALIATLGLERVLGAASTTRLRKRAVEVAMELWDTDTVAHACRDYPHELVWAVHDQRRSDYLTMILDMVDEYRTDPYLLDRITGCLARIAGPAELEYALDIATGVLSTFQTRDELDGAQQE